MFGRKQDYTLKTIDKIDMPIKIDSPMVTFIADDGYKKDFYSLAGISEKLNVPFCIALHDYYKENPINYMSKKNALYAQNELGWEIICHVGEELQF